MKKIYYPKYFLILFCFLIQTFLSKSFSQTVTTSVPNLSITGCTSAVNNASNFVVNGNNLISSVNIDAPTGIEISTDQITYSASISLVPTGGTVSSTVYVRLQSSSTSGNYNGTIFIHTTGAPDATVSLSAVMYQTPAVTVGAIDPIYTNSPFFTISYTLTGAADKKNLQTIAPNPMSNFNTNDALPGSPMTIVIDNQVAGNYNMSLQVFQSSAPACVSATANFNVQVLQQPVLSVNSNNIDISSCSGTLSEFSLEVSGSNLVDNIKVTAPAGIEVSTDNTNFFSSVVIPQNNGAADAPLTFRAKADFPPGNISLNLLITSTAADDLPVNLTGMMYQTPTVTVGTVTNVLSNATSFSLPLTITGPADHFNLDQIGSTTMTGFNSIVFKTLGAMPLQIPIPQSPAGVYQFAVSVVGACTSATENFTLQVDQAPAISVDKSSLDLTGSCTNGNPGFIGKFNVVAEALTNDVVIQAPSGVQLSSDNGATWATTLTIPNVSGNVSQEVDVQTIKNATAGSISGNIVVSSVNATTQNIALSGTVSQSPSFVIGSINAINTGSSSFDVPYTITGSATAYSLQSSGSNPMPGFNSIFHKTLNGSPEVVTVPASAPGDYTFQMNVEGGCYSDPVNFSVRVNSSNADLSKLSLNLGGGKVITYSPVNNSYNIDIPNAVSSVTLTPTLADGTASVTINSVVVANGTPSSSIPLTVGQNVVAKIVVTAQDGVTTKTTILNLYRDGTQLNLTSFSPTSASAGTTVVITGDNFTGTTDVTFGGTPAASFTVVSPTEIDAVVAHGSTGGVSVQGPSGFSLKTGFTYLSSLPLSIVKFEDVIKDDAVSLRWEVADPLLASEYFVTRSEDGINFKVIGTVNGSLSTTYIFTDPQPKSNGFYRITGMTKDGEKVYSEVLKIHSVDNQTSMTVFPNPFRGKSFNIVLHNHTTGNYELQLIDLTGKILLKKSIFINDQQSRYEISLPGKLASGNYSLKLLPASGATVTVQVIAVK